MKKTFTFLIAFLFSFVAFTQSTQKITKQERAEQIKAQKIAFLSTQLELTSEEAEKFWPIYNEYEAKIDAAHKSQKQHMKKLRNIDELSDDEAYTLAEAILEDEAKQGQIRKEYLGKFATVLSKKKAAKVYMAEEKFKRELLRKIKHGDHPKKQGPPGNRRP